jgi:ERCC4-type nuclease
MYWIDNRENDLIKLLQVRQEQVKQLSVGDIWIGISGEQMVEQGLIIERKSIRDLEASILDGRYREQRGRILAYCQENNTRPMYILEGSLSSSTGRLQKSAILKFINRLVLHYQISVLQTNSTQETAELVKALIEQWGTEDPQKSIRKKTDQVRVTDGIHIQKKVNALDHKTFAISCLAQCPGVSVKMADAIVTEFGTLADIMNAEPEQISQVKVGSRKIGPVVSKRLNDILAGLS